MDFHRKARGGPDSKDVRRFKKLWNETCTASYLERTQIVKYMALLKGPGTHKLREDYVSNYDLDDELDG